MTPEQQQAYDWAKNQSYPSVAAQYAKTLVGIIDEITARAEKANTTHCDICGKEITDNYLTINVLKTGEKFIFCGKCFVTENTEELVITCARAIKAESQLKEIGQIFNCDPTDIDQLKNILIGARVAKTNCKSELMLENVGINDGSIDLSLSGEPAKLFMANLITMFEQSGAENFLTITVANGGTKYAITIQNCDGEESPADKLSHLKYRAEKAEANKETLIKHLRLLCWCNGCTHFVGLDGCKLGKMENCTGKNDLYEFSGIEGGKSDADD